MNKRIQFLKIGHLENSHLSFKLENSHPSDVYSNSISKLFFKNIKVSPISNLTDLLQQCSKLSAILAIENNIQEIRVWSRIKKNKIKILEETKKIYGDNYNIISSR